MGLMGDRPVFDHHFLHVTFPPAYHAAGGLAKELAEPYIAEVYHDRSEWRGN